MIRGIDLFGREEVSPNERQIVKAANKTATDLFRKRFSPKLRDNWDIDIKDLTLEDVEREVILAVKKLKDNGRHYAKTIVREGAIG